MSEGTNMPAARRGRPPLPRELDWRAIAVASISPMQVRILETLVGRTMSPTEIAAELGEKLGNTSYHVRMLHGHGLVVLVDTQPRRGALQHYYACSPGATRVVRGAQEVAA
jgi:hypothetical protein